LGYLLESRLRHIKVLQWKVAPASIVIGLAWVRRTEVGCSHNGRRISRNASPDAITLYFEASSAGEPAIVQCGAQCHRLHPVSKIEDIAIATGTTCTVQSKKSGVKQCGRQ